jgi:DNA-binding response OmpR family regulator
MMPKLDGREVARIMKSTPAYAEIPVLLMSAAERNSARIDDAPFLHKPFDITELLRRIEEALAKKR